jgi:ATP-binding cassette subfamily C protein
MGAMLPVQTALTNAQSLVPLGKLAREILAPPVVTERNDRLLEKYSSAGQHGGDEGQGFDISLANVSFSHAGTVEKAIVDVSMHVDAGSFVALIGPSGAGKTTLADLILGLRTPSSGEVAVRGQPPSEKRKTAPGSISYVPQSPGMVTGSIAENVALGVSRDSIDRDQVWKVIRQAQLADFVDSLPFGIDSDFGRQSEALSAGQKQRMGLARALYSNPRLLVLDEATSALDALTESGISETIASLGQETTVIVIAHRLSTIQQADVVFVVEGGRITARGGFNEVRAEVPLIEEYVRLMSFE